MPSRDRNHHFPNTVRINWTLIIGLCHWNIMLSLSLAVMKSYDHSMMRLQTLVFTPAELIGSMEQWYLGIIFFNWRKCMAKSYFIYNLFLERGTETNLKTSWTQRGLGLNVKAYFSPLYVAQTQCIFYSKCPFFLRGCWDFRVSSRTMLIQGLTL